MSYREEVKLRLGLILRCILRSLTDAAAIAFWDCEMLHTVDLLTCCNRMGFSVKTSEP